MTPESNSSDGHPPPLNLHKFAADETPGDSGQTVFIRKTAGKLASETDESLPPGGNDDFGLPFREMLGLITYCYKKGVFCSRDIAALLRAEPALRSKFGSELPEGDDIRRFRRRYSNEIEDILEETFRAFPENTVSNEAASGEFRKKAIDQVHEAAWTDNTRGRLS